MVHFEEEKVIDGLITNAQHISFTVGQWKGDAFPQKQLKVYKSNDLEDELKKLREEPETEPWDVERIGAVLNTNSLTDRSSSWQLPNIAVTL
ncbi:unnamed protein product [Angiostrongylus costaricensis]|uniref:Lipoxygenase domain-containing protein n=1 Tax=Angiostrongylus costaricensis TaxID=334426 RepID=A0A0R3PI32_ANGCS|nr:unnamed protein product [Angiostrongylus costaricensis]